MITKTARDLSIVARWIRLSQGLFRWPYRLTCDPS